LRSLGPYWRQRDWRHDGDDTALRGRRTGSLFGIPIYVRLGAVFYTAVLLGLMANGIYDGGVYLALGAGMVAAMALGVGLHELGHAAAARRLGQTVEGAMVGLWGAAVVWGAAGESASPRDVAVVAAAGPVVNAGLAADGLITALSTRGDVRVFFAVQVA
jgi:Zn-dependent protease